MNGHKSVHNSTPHNVITQIQFDMKKFLLAMVIAIISVMALPAQNSGRQQMTAQQRTEQRIKKLDEKLSLTDEQKTEIRKLYADFNKQQPQRGKRKEAMEKLTANIMLVLTPEQQVIYKQMIEEGLAERKKGVRNRQKE